MIPSRKTLEQAFPGKGRELRELLEGKRKTRSYASVRELCEQCYSPPSYQHRLETALNEVLEGHGAEAIFAEGELRPDAAFINLGDTYTTTLLYDYTRGRWRVMSPGDWIEAQEQRGVMYA